MSLPAPSQALDPVFAFLSILLEGIPFILLGSLISGIIDAWLPSGAMDRLLPKRALPALLPARIAGRSLARLERAGFDPFSGAGESDPLQSWRLAFAALTGRF